ncbi:MAG TPA: FadR/GntR family transcriptional regulator [Pilimelia sp.]|nr:FadR/GntR family transcriptional regulator [Pilimelia sp.]
MALTDEAIAKIKDLIQSGQLGPGSRLPPEQQLSAQLGLSRSSMREAIKALEMARVIDVRRGDGTYVTSLAPGLLLAGFAVAVDLLQDDDLLEVMEARRLLEPVATGLAASRVTDRQLGELRELLEHMRAAIADGERLAQYDAAFHRAVIAATGNEALASILDGLASRTLRARVWRGITEANAAERAVAEHESIYLALHARNELLAQSTALIHVDTADGWLRAALGRAKAAPDAA